MDSEDTVVESRAQRSFEQFDLIVVGGQNHGVFVRMVNKILLDRRSLGKTGTSAGCGRIRRIDHIDVFHAEKQDGITTQRVVIYCNCVGAFMVPDRRKIPEADIIIETRRGVALSYAPMEIAV